MAAFQSVVSIFVYHRNRMAVLRSKEWYGKVSRFFDDKLSSFWIFRCASNIVHGYFTGLIRYLLKSTTIIVVLTAWHLLSVR